MLVLEKYTFRLLQNFLLRKFTAC